MPEGGFALALIRGLTVAALLSAFGCLVFRLVVLPRVIARVPAARGTDPALRTLAQRSLAAAVPLLLAWSVLQAAELAQTGPHLVRIAAAWPVVVASTVFGHVWLAQLAAVVAALGLVPRWPGAAAGPCTLALLLQAGHSHALSMNGGPSLLLGSDIVHLLAAGAWLGGLWPLLLVVRETEPRGGALAARWYSPLGKWCVAGLVLSAAYQSWELIGGLPGLIGTAYGRVALVKLGLLAILLGFAMANRYRLAPALLRGPPEAARRRLIRSIAVQTGFGLAVVLAAGVLSELPPSLHEQPLWPFPLRPSLVAMAEPELAAEVWTGLGIAGLAACLLAALAWRRLRRPAGMVLLPLAGALLAWLALPHLSLLLVEAYPTSYYTSPTGFAAASITEGARLYPGHCASCHGATGHGDGPAAASLPIPPADLTAAHLWEHADGEMFWWLTHGIPAPDGTPAMPGFAGLLSPDQRWSLIDAVRANNAGAARRATGTWPRPIAVPAFTIDCPRADPSAPEAMRGRVLYLVADAAASLPPDTPGMVSVLLTRGRPPPDPSRCSATDPAAWDALALLTGASPDSFAGTRLLVDPNGWLRTVRTPGTAPAWNDPAILKNDVRAILDEPLAPAGGGHHHH